MTQPESSASANSAIPAIMLLFTDGAQTACHHYDSFIIIPRRSGFVKRKFSFSGSFFQEVNSQSKCNSAIRNCIQSDNSRIFSDRFSGLFLRFLASDRVELT